MPLIFAVVKKTAYKRIVAAVAVVAAIALSPAVAQTNKARIDSLLKVLDYTIQKKSDIKAEKIKRIVPLKQSLDYTDDLDKRFQIATQLFQEYKSFSIDSSLYYARQARSIADSMHNPLYQWCSMLMEAESQKGLGYFYRSLQILDSLPQEAYDTIGYAILERYCSVFYSLSENSTTPYDPARKHLLEYRQQLIDQARNPIDSAINLIEYNITRGNYQGAIDIYDKVIADNPEGLESVRPMLDYIVSNAYIKTGKTDQAIEYMAQAAISDLRCGNRRYNALPTLATLLNERGDVNRAYSYIMCSLEDINDSKAASRMYRVTEAVPIITQARTANENQIHRYTVVVNVLVIVLLLLLGFTVIRMRKSTTKLVDKHKKLQLSTRQLVEEKHQTDRRNEHLEKRGRTQDDNIGELFNLCSDYIHTMAKDHSALLKVSKTGSPRDIEKALDLMQAPDRLSAFFERFDKAILDIYPNYVEKFNALLDPQKQIVPPAGRLTPELRICALMKLGITDTSKIASFLRYSVQTVYNYQFKIRSASSLPREELLDAIMAI